MDTNLDSLKEHKICAFKKIHADLKRIMQHERCRTCSCLYADVMSTIYDRIRHFQEKEFSSRLTQIQRDFEGWLKDANTLEVHG